MATLTHFDPETQSLKQKKHFWTGLPKPTTIDLVGGISCHICQKTLANKKDFDTHYVLHNTGNKDIVYTCVVCHKQIAGYPSFRGHCYTMHVIKGRFKCQYCFKLFSKSTAINEHVKIMHKFKCTVCNKEFTSKKELHLHKFIHDSNHDTPPFNCQSCKMKIESIEGCKEHIFKHCLDIYSCPICNENIPNKEKANDHLKTHFSNVDDTVSDGSNDVKEEISNEKGREVSISCLFCSTDYKNRVEFDAHFSWMHGEEDIVYTCVECGEQFEKYSKFNSHTYDHYAKKRYQCDLCSKAFCRLSLLVSHMSACQEDSEASGMPFICAHCKCRYSSAITLRRHMRNIHDILHLICPEEGCQLTFSKPDQLIFHQKRHHQSSKNWCGQCGLYFKSLHSCERHLDIHKKKLYICPVCNRHYSDKNVIVNHVSQHFEAVLHLCKVCGKVFNAKNRLVEHTKTHSETKCHKCQYCRKSFMKIAQLQQHLNVHTGSKPYKCPFCEKSFTSYPNWSKHISRMHNVDGKNYKNMLLKSKEVVINKNSENEIENILNKKFNTISNNADNAVKVPNKTDDYIFQGSDKYTIESSNIALTIIEKKETLENDKNNTEAELYKCPNLDSKNYKNKKKPNIEAFTDENVQKENINNEIEVLNNKTDNISPNTDNTAKISNENIDNYMFYEITENTIESNSIDHTVIEKEVETFENVVNDKNGNQFGNVLPENKNMSIDGIQGSLTDISQFIQTVDCPPEYGPEFNTGLESSWGSTFIDLDDHNLPHIDPLLTIKIEEHNKMYVDRQNYYEPSNIQFNNYGNTPKWEPPVLTKFHHDYTYGYGDIAESNRLTLLNSDNFEVFT